jgi:hypothetical protein
VGLVVDGSAIRSLHVEYGPYTRRCRTETEDFPLSCFLIVLKITLPYLISLNARHCNEVGKDVEKLSIDNYYVKSITPSCRFGKDATGLPSKCRTIGTDCIRNGFCRL